LHVRLSNALFRADGHRRFPEDAKFIKKMAYRLPTVNRTIATVRLALPELSSSFAEREACFLLGSRNGAILRMSDLSGAPGLNSAAVSKMRGRSTSQSVHHETVSF
jgi:hypothetical protein